MKLQLPKMSEPYTRVIIETPLGVQHQTCVPGVNEIEVPDNYTIVSYVGLNCGYKPVGEPSILVECEPDHSDYGYPAYETDQDEHEESDDADLVV